jgi:hypothetical protein
MGCVQAWSAHGDLWWKNLASYSGKLGCSVARSQQSFTATSNKNDGHLGTFHSHKIVQYGYIYGHSTRAKYHTKGTLSRDFQLFFNHSHLALRLPGKNPYTILTKVVSQNEDLKFQHINFSKVNDHNEIVLVGPMTPLKSFQCGQSRTNKLFT